MFALMSKVQLHAAILARAESVMTIANAVGAERFDYRVRLSALGRFRRQ